MNERAVQFWVGAMVVSSVLLGGILILALGPDRSLFQGVYTLHITFTDAPGVAEHTPVRRSGILIGRVTKVDLLPSGVVKIDADVYNHIKVPDNAVCTVHKTLLGDAELVFTAPTEGVSKTYFAHGAQLTGQRSDDPLDAMADLKTSLAGAIDSVANAGQKLDGTLTRINNTLDQNQGHVNSIMKRTDETLKLLQDSAGFTNELMENPEFRQNLKVEFERLPETLRGAREAVAQIKTTMQNMNHTMSLVDANLENIKNFTEPLGNSGQQIAQNIDESARRMNQLMIELETFGKTINSRQSSLGLLTQDDELYQRLNRTVRNAEEISYRLKPVINDVRIISDRLARHPGSILRDAVRPGAGTKGLPPMYHDPGNSAAQPASWMQ